jgi:beta-glucosidase
MHTPGVAVDGITGDVAVDHYHRYKEDVALMKDISANAYRFSIASPRIFPNGNGQPNQKGLDFYSRLLDELKAANIEPFATLFHWDMPQALQDKGGWQSRDTSKAFGDYAGYVAEKLSDRIRHFFTLNELSTHVEYGHKNGVGAPGLKLPPAQLNQVRHHHVLGLAWRFRPSVPRPARGPRSGRRSRSSARRPSSKRRRTSRQPRTRCGSSMRAT